MKIKKLTIHGFKSFVDKATLNFSSGTSGIIGPNGCGKSNIVDAIRWVIGEQNPRHLRGKHMEDIIFNGSDTRKPLGMAEVVLTFSNESGNAPARYASFSEIEIARRLYRSGESEYYINKVHSRLRDIVELFTDTGIGTKAYSIVEQGQVGWLINAKPEERRVIFEEAAGINRFKQKKDAALRRLAATRENLTRVSDIISEVKRQLNSLNRQAKKAERYKAMRDELQGVDLHLCSLEFSRMRDGIDALDRRLAAIRDDEMALANTAAAREGLAEELRAEYLGVETEFKAVRERVFELERQIQEQERTSALVKMRIEELGRNVERLGHEIEELTGGIESEKYEIENLRSSAEGLSAQIEKDAGALEEAAGELARVSGELQSTQESQREEKTESLRISTRLTDIRHSLHTLIKDEDNLRVREAKALSESEEVMRSLAASVEPIARLKEEIEGAEGKKASIEEQSAVERSRLGALENDRSTLSAELASIKDDYAKAASRLAALEDMEKNFENLHGGARAIMQKQDRSGIHGILADCIETNPGYEKAVEAVLGDRLQYVIVESHKEGVEAIEYLKANSSGRSSFVPVRDLRAAAQPVPASNAAYTPPGAKSLLGEIRIKDGYQSIVGYLLGDTLIVDDMDTALDAWKNGGTFKTIVTRTGEIIDPQGIITGGASGSSDAGILQKRGEIKSITARVAGLEEKVASTQARLKDAEGGIADAKARIEELREMLHGVDIERLRMVSDLKRLEEDSSRLESLKANLSGEITEAAARLEAISVKKAELARERETLDAELEKREEASSDFAGEIERLTEEKERLAHTVTELKITLAQSRERHGSVTRELAAREAAIEEAGRKIAAKKAEIENSEAEAEEKSEELGTLKAAIEEILASRDTVRAEEVSRSHALREIEEKIQGVEAELKKTKAEASELLELKGELTIEHKEAELAIENLREKVNEKYNREIESYEIPQDAEPVDEKALGARKRELAERIGSLGEVSMSALEEYAELEERYKFLLDQQSDLTNSVDSLHRAISRINRTTREKFRNSFDEINTKFKESFPRFFNGGRAELRLSDDGDILESGIEIVAQPPGKRLQNITLLSGGEKALTATSLIFSIFLTKPSPFCLLDEVDAPLDDANIDRFNIFVKDMSKISQFLLITHNKKTMEMADTLYGVTMAEPGVSKVITLEM